MATSVQYVTWSLSGHVRLEIIQVDNGANYVNVSCNFQVGPDFGGDGTHEGDWQSFDSTAYSLTLTTSGGTTLTASGTNGTYPTSPPYGWKSIATKWIGTIARGGTFNIVWTTKWLDTDFGILRDCTVTASNISVMAYVPPNAVDDLSNYSAATIGTSLTFTITNTTEYSHTDSLTYSIGGTTGTITSGLTVASGASKTVTWTPPSSLGSEITDSFSGTVTLTLSTSGVGSNTYTCMLTVPTYTYSLSALAVAKTTYAAIGGSSYVAGKHTAQWTMPSFPSAKYSASISGTFTILSGTTTLYSTSISGGGTASYTHGSAGTITGKLTVTDSRGVSVSKTLSITYVDNPSVKITSYSITRNGQTTTINYSAVGTYDSTLSGNTGTLTIECGGVDIDTASGSSGTATIAANTTTQSTTDTEVYYIYMTDGLGNTKTRKVTIGPAFFYLQVGGGSDGHGVSIGRAATTSGTAALEVGLPTIIDGTLRPEAYLPYLTEDTDNVTHDTDNIVHAPAVKYGDLGLSLSDTLADKLKALTTWLYTNYTGKVTPSRVTFMGSFVAKADNSLSHNLFYIIHMYQLNSLMGGAPNYTHGIAWSLNPSEQLFSFGNYNGTFSVYQYTGNAYTS